MSISVALIDDSAVARQVITQALAPAGDIKVITTATDPVNAMLKMQNDWPDVIVLDVDMPRMDGITFLKKLMSEHPTPVVICSALGENNAKIAVHAMSAGAVGVVNKPFNNGFLQKEELSILLIDEIRAASRARIARRYKPPPSAPADPMTRTTVGVGREPPPPSGSSTAAVLANAMQERQSAPRQNADVMLPPPRPGAAANQIRTAQHIVAIGISTGGPQALELMLPKLPAKSPGIVIVQHMPGTLTGAFAKRLNELSAITVKEAKDGDQIQPGQALVCPGSQHMMIRRSGVNYFVTIKDGPLVNRHRPSVDVLFRSAAACGINATAFLMTGMGDDGARGMKEMFDCGAHTVAQDEASCTVFGMPKEAIRLGAVKETLTLDAIAAKIAALGR